MQCALASLNLFRPFKRAIFPENVDLLQKISLNNIKEDRKNQIGNKMIYVQFFGPKFKRLIKHSSILYVYMGRPLNPLFVTLQEIDKSKD